MASKLAEVFVDITGNAAPLHKTLAGVKDTLMGMGNINLAPIGQGLAAGGAAAGVGLLKAFQSASVLNATLSKTKGIFGDSAGEVIDQADEMARKFGQSTSESLGAAASFGSAFKGWVEAIAGGSETVGVIGRNLGDSFAPAGVSIDEFFTHWGEQLSHAAGAAGAFASYLAENWRERILAALEAIGTAAWNFAGNVASAVKEAWHSLISLGKDPIEITLFKPLREAFDASDLPRSSSPEPHPTDFESRRRSIHDAMFDLDRKRLEADARKGVAIARGNSAIDAGDGAAASGSRTRPEDLLSFGNTLPNGFLGKDTARQSLKVQQQHLDVARQHLALQKKPPGAMPGIAVGPA
jgi:hypothetical protein